MTRLTDYVTEIQGVPEAPTDGQTYGRDGQNGSWVVIYNKTEAEAAFAAIVHTHPYVSLTANEVVNGQKQFNDSMGIGTGINAAYGLNVAGSINVGAGSNFFINGSPIESFVDAPADGSVYGRQNNGWAEINVGGGGTITNLATIYYPGYVTITNSGGQDTNINAASATNAGVMTSSDKQKLDSALADGEVNLGVTKTSTTNTITNTAGSNAALSGATTSLAGLMTAADKQTLDGLEGSSLPPGSAGNILACSGGTSWYANNWIQVGGGITEVRFSVDAMVRRAGPAAFEWYNTSGSSNNRRWTMNANGNDMFWYATSDSGSAGTSGMTVTRSGSNIVEFVLTGSAAFNGPNNHNFVTYFTPQERTDLLNFLETQGVLTAGRASQINAQTVQAVNRAAVTPTSV